MRCVMCTYGVHTVQWMGRGVANILQCGIESEIKPHSFLFYYFFFFFIFHFCLYGIALVDWSHSLDEEHQGYEDEEDMQEVERTGLCKRKEKQ